jgi:hypothetical protein
MNEVIELSDKARIKLLEQQLAHKSELCKQWSRLCDMQSQELRKAHAEIVRLTHQQNGE